MVWRDFLIAIWRVNFDVTVAAVHLQTGEETVLMKFVTEFHDRTGTFVVWHDWMFVIVDADLHIARISTTQHATASESISMTMETLIPLGTQPSSLHLERNWVMITTHHDRNHSHLTHIVLPE